MIRLFDEDGTYTDQGMVIAGKIEKVLTDIFLENEGISVRDYISVVHSASFMAVTSISIEHKDEKNPKVEI